LHLLAIRALETFVKADVWVPKVQPASEDDVRKANQPRSRSDASTLSLFGGVSYVNLAGRFPWMYSTFGHEVSTVVQAIVHYLLSYANQVVISISSFDRTFQLDMFSPSLVEKSFDRDSSRLKSGIRLPPLGCLVGYLKSLLGLSEHAFQVVHSLASTLQRVGDLTPSEIDDVRLNILDRILIAF